MSDLQKIQSRIEALIGKRLLASSAQRERITAQLRKLRAERDLLVLVRAEARQAVAR